jgi:ribosomal protein S18 acetylase RimI-like enzyme
MKSSRSNVVVRRVGSRSDLELARQLIREYGRSLGVDLRFQDFEHELATLPGECAPPLGGLWIAWVGASPAGCVGLRKWSRSDAEMKSLFVRSRFRRCGIGLRLINKVLEAARRAGYSEIRLDTLPSMRAAQALYTAVGFRFTQRYRVNPVPGARFMRLDLVGCN